MRKDLAASAISMVASVAALAVAWQAVRFCQGSIGAPVIDQLVVMLHESYGEPIRATSADGQLIQAGLAWLSRYSYYLSGIAVWLGLALTVSSLGASTARIVEVGFSQYMAECKEAEEEHLRRAAMEAARERRRERRRKHREAQQPKASFGFGTLLLGIIIGKIL